MFTPPHDHPPSLFDEDIRQSGDGRPEPPDSFQNELQLNNASEYETPNNSNNNSLLLNNSRNWNNANNISMMMANAPCAMEDTMDDEFVSFHSPSTALERYAPLGLSDRDLDDRFSFSGNGASVNGKEGLVKWKGIVLTPDDEFVEEAHLGLVTKQH